MNTIKHMVANCAVQQVIRAAMSRVKKYAYTKCSTTMVFRTGPVEDHSNEIGKIQSVNSQGKMR